MKIVFLSGLYPPQTKGGGEISTYLIAEGLKARGHEVEVITGKEIPELLKKPLFERRQARHVAFEIQRVLPAVSPPPGARHRAFRAAGGGPPRLSPATAAADIIHAHDFRSALALSELQTPSISPLSGGVVKRESSPDKGRWGGVSVATIRDYAPVCGTTNNILADGSRCHCTLHDVLKTKRFQEVGFPRNLARAWQYWHSVSYRKEAFQKLKNQIFISGAQQTEIEEQLDLSAIQKTIIYNPVSKDYLNTPVEEGRRGSVLYVGRLEDYKGVGLLLAAWEEIARETPEAHLTLVGEGAQQGEYEQWVERRGLQYRVAFAGRIPFERLRSVYNAAEVVVAPHIWTEPFGRTAVEAMARGKVVVAANCGGPGEIIQDGKTGILFERNSKAGFAKGLRAALEMRPLTRRDFGAAARAWVRENLTQENIAQQYEDFYGRILDKT